MIRPGFSYFAGWYGFIGAPLLALTAQLTQFIIAPWACATGLEWPLHLTSFLFLIAAAAGGVAAHRAWRAHGAHEIVTGVSFEHRIGFLLILSMLMSALASLIVFAMWLPVLFLGACD